MIGGSCRVFLGSVLDTRITGCTEAAIGVPVPGPSAPDWGVSVGQWMVPLARVAVVLQLFVSVL